MPPDDFPLVLRQTGQRDLQAANAFALLDAPAGRGAVTRQFFDERDPRTVFVNRFGGAGGTPFAPLAFLGVFDQVFRDGLQPGAEGPRRLRLEAADGLGGPHEGLVQDVVGAGQPLQIAGDPPGLMSLQTVVMQQ